MSSIPQPDSARLLAQFQLKTLHSILAARIPSDPNPNPTPTRTHKRDRWFNLALPDVTLPNSQPPNPLILDVILSPDDVIAERWSLTCDSRAPSSDSPVVPAARAYKKSIVLFRSLHSLLRLLPCFRIFKILSSMNLRETLTYRISSFEIPMSRDDEASFESHVFEPIETQLGFLNLSVMYRPAVKDLLDLEPTAVIAPTIIADYVGSPIADPMREFPSSPSPASITRPHSWSEIPRGEKALYRKASFSLDELRGISSSNSNAGVVLVHSPTPSPPAYGSGGIERMRLETTPVSIPGRGFLPPLLPRNAPRGVENASLLLSEGSGRSFRKSEALKLGDFYSNLALQKGLKDGRDDSGKFSGVFSSGGSPRFGYSRSSSRLSNQDDLDDCDFSCPFAVDDVDTSDSQTRNREGKDVTEPHTLSSKSNDAAVGALVHMLRTAAPLRPDLNYSSQSSRSELNDEAGNSSFFVSRKTSDALEELRMYKEMKELLLSQSRTH